jgi:hypothetical protein
MKNKPKEIRAWAVFIGQKPKAIYEHEQEARAYADLEKYMPLRKDMGHRSLSDHVSRVSVRRIRIIVED